MKKEDIHNKQYFEGILQLRNATLEVMDMAEDLIQQMNIHVAKKKTVRGGKDYYLGDNKQLSILGRKLKQKFSGQLLETTTLHTADHQSGKELYRLTVLFRYVPFKVNDEVIFKGKKAKVTRLGPKVEIKYMDKGKRELVPYQDFLAKAKS